MNTDFEKFEAELLKKTEIKAEYDALSPKYDAIREQIRKTLSGADAPESTCGQV